MYRVREEDLPFRGSSYEFVGADNGDVNISVFLLRALPGHGPGPHRHPYDEVQFVREGRGLWTVKGQEFGRARGTFWSSRLVRFTGFAALVRSHWSSSTYI